MDRLLILAICFGVIFQMTACSNHTETNRTALRSQRRSGNPSSSNAQAQHKEYPILLNVGTTDKPNMKYFTPAQYQAMMREHHQKIVAEKDRSNNQSNPNQNYQKRQIPAGYLPPYPTVQPSGGPSPGVTHGKDKVVIVTETEIDIPRLRQELNLDGGLVAPVTKRPCICRRKDILLGNTDAQESAYIAPTGLPQRNRNCQPKSRQFLESTGCKKIACRKAITQKTHARISQTFGDQQQPATAIIDTASIH